MKDKIFCLLFVLCAVPLFSDELDEALSSLRYGEGMSFSLRMGISPQGNHLDAGAEFPVNSFLRIFPFFSVLFGSGEDTLMGGGLSFWMGAPASSEKWRVYGGPSVKLFYRRKNPELFTGGYGGIEFFSSPAASVSIETGGGYQFVFGDLHKGKIFFSVSGKFSFYL